MRDYRPVAAHAMQRPRLRSAILVGTALGGVVIWAGPVWAQTACTTSANCTNSGASSGLSVALGTSVSALTNTASGVISVNSGSYAGISNSGTVGTLLNNGSISSTSSAGISNSGSVGTLVNSGVITVSGGSYADISNSGSIGTLASAGQSTSVTGQSIVNNAGTTISNTSGSTLSNTGTVGMSAGIGVYNNFTGTTVTNTGTIDGIVPTANTGANTIIAVGVYNDSGGDITSLTNGTNAVIEASGTTPYTPSNTAGYGIDNLGTIGTLTNNGTVTNQFVSGGTSSTASYAIENTGSIGTLNNNGTINGYTLGQVGSPATYGIDNHGSIGALNNSGTILSGNGSSGASIENEVGGFIGTIANTGLISVGANDVGILNNGTIGTITNGTGNYIIGTGAASIENTGIIGTLSNSGFVQGTTGLNSEVGLLNTAGTIGLLQNTGTISGLTAGVTNQATIGTLDNSGTILGSISSGTNPPSTYGINNTGTIAALSNSGTIQAGSGGNGVQNGTNGYVGTLTNSGLITDGPGARGLANFGTIGLLNNQQTGTITGTGIAGLSNDEVISTLNNSGLIQGDSTDGLLNGDGSMGTLNNSGTIEGISTGIQNFSTISTLVNSGIITASGANGIALNTQPYDFSTAFINTLLNTGTISATGNGGNGIVNMQTINMLVNSGIITASGTNGIALNTQSYQGSTAVIGTLLNTGTISATGNGGNGIVNTQTIGILANSGSILGGAGGYGINNTGSIGELASAGQVITANNQTLTNNAGSTVADNTTLSVNNTGTIGLLIGTGVYNNSQGVTLSNAGTITGAPITVGGAGTVAASVTAGIYNDSTGSLTLTNQGDINATEYGLYNAGTISALTNSGTIAATSSAGTAIFNTTGNTITTLTNSGVIADSAGGTGLDNSGTIGTLNNSGTITGATDALYLGASSTLGTFINSGTVAGSIENASSQPLSISGATGSGMGTLTGYNGTVGSLFGSQAGILFTSGNLLLNDNITAPTITNSGANLLVNGNISAFSPIAVTGGALEVGDSSHSSAHLTGDVNVSGTGLLSGSGTIVGNVVNSGIVSPNTPSGTLSVTGNYTQNNDGVLNVAVSPTGDSVLNVGSTAQLSGALALSVSHLGSYNIGTPYVIVQAQTITGSGLTYGSPSYQSAVDTALAHYLTAQIITSPTTVALELTPNKGAFSSGHVYAAGQYGQTSALQGALAAPLDLQGASAPLANGYWLHGLGGFGSANGGNFNNEGFVAGRGFALSPNLTIGGALSNVYTNNNEDGSSGRSTTLGGLAYGIYTQGPFNIAGSVGGGYIHNHTERYLAGLGWHAKSSSDGAYEGASLRGQYNLLPTDSPYFIAPYATASYLHSHVGAAQESNAGLLNLHYGSITTNLAQMGGGARLGVNLPVQAGTFTLWGDLGGVGTLGNPRVGVTESLGRFTGRSSALVAPSGAFAPGVGVQFQGTNPWRVSTGWNGLFGDATHAQSFTLQLSARW